MLELSHMGAPSKFLHNVIPSVIEVLMTAMMCSEGLR